MTNLEHVNVTVPNPAVTAQMLIDLFGWHIRWEGVALDDGFTVHVGTDDSYVALYTGPDRGRAQTPATDNYLQRGGLNHMGVVVDDLDGTEAKVTAMGLQTHSHADYEPGKRFYFKDPDGVEYEVICYA
jgi:catechol 2,3-dioxygenase-like lactoylglutathione lyase family enzyme